MTTGKALNGKPYAGNPHVRFDEGEVASAATPRRGSLLYVIKFSLTKGITSIYNGIKRVIKAVPRKLGLTQDVFTASAATTPKGMKTAREGVSPIKQGISKIKREASIMSDDISKVPKSNEQSVPNYVISKQEASGITCVKIKFYPEDIEKMKNMTKEEIFKYETSLIKEGRYYL